MSLEEIVRKPRRAAQGVTVNDPLHTTRENVAVVAVDALGPARPSTFPTGPALYDVPYPP